MKRFRLTADERGIIERVRAQKAADEQRRKREKQVLRLTVKYIGWLEREGRGSTFSTFVNEFGYDEHDSSQVYKVIEAIKVSLREAVMQSFPETR